MNVYRVLPRLDGRYDFTMTTDDHTSPVGYCRAWREWGDDLKKLSPAAWERYVANREKYHGHGHATPQEAADCYRQYLLDSHLRLMRENPDVQNKCLVCGAWTSHYAALEGHRYHLCPEHNTREQVEARLTITADTEIVSSF